MAKLNHQKLNFNIRQSKSNSYIKATKKQLELLDKLGVDFPKGISKESASILIKNKLKA